jgi:hypothetical protein
MLGTDFKEAAMRSIAAVAIALVTAFASAPASAQSTPPAVALILEVHGSTNPDLKPFREVRAGDRVALERAGKLVLLHYDRECRKITIEGGTVTFRRGGEPTVQDGIVSSTEGKCPRRLEARSTSGAIVMRDTPAKLAQAPSFTVTGARAGDIGAVRILDQSRMVLETPVAGPHFQWPTGVPALGGSKHYTVEFLSRDSRAVLASVAFFTADSPTEETAPALIIIE